MIMSLTEWLHKSVEYKCWRGVLRMSTPLRTCTYDCWGDPGGADSGWRHSVKRWKACSSAGNLQQHPQCYVPRARTGVFS